VTPGERPGSPRARLFLALELPAPLLDELIGWRDAVLGSRDELRLLPRTSLHVTLVFLGYQAERDIPEIAELSLSRPAARFELLAETVVGVPPSRPRLYALALEDTDESLRAWQADVSGRLADARFYEPEKRAFWPHVTLARFKRGASPPRASGVSLPELPADLREPFEPERATLFRSLLRPAGAVYEPLATLDLDGSGAISFSSAAE
jgi:RNA 2',3'-cyclic 3'-phosphodiesterase